MTVSTASWGALGRAGGQPVVAIVGQTARTAMGADYQQEVDLNTLFKDVAHHYVHECTHPASAGWS